MVSADVNFLGKKYEKGQVISISHEQGVPEIKRKHSFRFRTTGDNRGYYKER